MTRFADSIGKFVLWNKSLPGRSLCSVARKCIKTFVIFEITVDKWKKIGYYLVKVVETKINNCWFNKNEKERDYDLHSNAESGTGQNG